MKTDSITREDVETEISVFLYDHYTHAQPEHAGQLLKAIEDMGLVLMPREDTRITAKYIFGHAYMEMVNEFQAQLTHEGGE